MAITNQLQIREQTEAGDIARSLEGMIRSQFINRDFMSLITATRFTRLEVEEFSNMNYIGTMSRIMRVTDDDVTEKALANLDDYSKSQLKESLILKKAMTRNAWVIYEVEAFAWMYMYSAGMQSLEGMSRKEGSDMVSGTTGRILDKDKMGFWDKLGRRFSGRGMEYVE